MNRELAKQLLLEGKTFTYSIFSLTYKNLTCEEGCCEDYFSDLEEALNQLERLCDGDWSEVKCTSSS